jgi:hypothetical protein
MGTWPALALLAASLAGCGEGGETAARAAAGSSGRAEGTKPALSEPCTLITAADIERISSYAGAVRREVNSDSVCWWTVDGQRLGVSISVGRYVPSPFLGGSEVDLGGGIRGRRSTPAGRIRSSCPTRARSRSFSTARRSLSAAANTAHPGDGRKVDLQEQYSAYARTIAGRLW